MPKQDKPATDSQPKSSPERLPTKNWQHNWRLPDEYLF